MATDVAARKSVRRLCGDPDETEMPNDKIDEFLGDAVDWLNKRDPGRAIGSLTTVADQQDYDRPDDAYLVTSVFWSTLGYAFLSADIEASPELLEAVEQLDGFNVVEQPSIVEAMLKHVEMYRQNFDGSGFEYNGKIRLAPCPTTSGTDVYFEYTYPRWDYVSDLPAARVDALEKYAAALALQWLFIRRGIIRSSRDFSGGGGANEKTMADELKAVAEGLVPMAGLTIGRG